MNKNEKAILDRHMGCNSTHKNISIMLTAQCGFSLPPSVRRMCSVLCLWKGHDLNALSIMSSRFGIKSKDLKYFFEKVATGKFSFRGCEQKCGIFREEMEKEGGGESKIERKRGEGEKE